MHEKDYCEGNINLLEITKSKDFLDFVHQRTCPEPHNSDRVNFKILIHIWGLGCGYSRMTGIILVGSGLQAHLSMSTSWKKTFFRRKANAS